MLFVAELLIVVVVGLGCSSRLSRNKEALLSERVFADLPASTSAPDNPAVDFKKMRPGDEIVINFTRPDGTELPFGGIIRDDGTVTLLSNKVFIAAEKTTRDFEKEIANFYGPKLYLIPVAAPAPIEVSGEVEAPGKCPFSAGMTVLKAIESAGGNTERANLRKVKLIRGDGRQFLVNCVQARREAQLDVPVFPDDRIIVPGRFW
jgi:protein involved in polysaccharide export with SLBB domain